MAMSIAEPAVGPRPRSQRVLRPVLKLLFAAVGLLLVALIAGTVYLLVLPKRPGCPAANPRDDGRPP